MKTRVSRYRIPFFLMLALMVAFLLAVPVTQAGKESQAGRNTTWKDMEAMILADQQPAEDRPAQAATPCVGGFAGGYPCHNVDLLSFTPLAALGGTAGNDVWGATGCGGRNFALMGLNNGTAFVEITDPENPVLLGNLPTATSSSSWRDIKTDGRYAFIVSEASGHGMQVFNMGKLCHVDNPPVTFTADAHDTSFGNAHNLVINERSNYAYAVGTSTCAGGLRMIDISNPLSPSFAGCYSGDGYTHDAQCVNYRGPDPDHQGQEICFAANEDTLTIVDVTNKAAPALISRTGYAGDGYTHQGWALPNHRWFVLDDELDELYYGHNTRTRFFNIVDLDNPTLPYIYESNNPAIDHNLYINRGLIYQANYRSGLRILGRSGANMVEVGYFDIYPSNDNPSFNGAWSVYIFRDGTVIVSGIEQGLFVLQPTLTAEAQIDWESLDQ